MIACNKTCTATNVCVVRGEVAATSLCCQRMVEK